LPWVGSRSAPIGIPQSVLSTRYIKYLSGFGVGSSPVLIHIIGDVTLLAAPGHQLLDRAGDGLGKGPSCCVLLRRIPNAHRSIMHETPPLSATGQVTSRGSRRGATATIKEHGSGPGARDTCAASPCPIATCRTSGEDNPRDLRGALHPSAGEAPPDSTRCVRARSSCRPTRRSGIGSRPPCR